MKSNSHVGVFNFCAAQSDLHCAHARTLKTRKASFRLAANQPHSQSAFCIAAWVNKGCDRPTDAVTVTAACCSAASMSSQCACVCLQSTFNSM
ncbi:unnamed protein product [Ceratitis capitata]|uniref:(Mediterranean fruit fly) hypothetical protein n=1 Tax=Ceratitis capitata TaxID=7213 RepID=A0A811V6K7_CERCA|nr:unnamed protein product [Ceratitis capitata]